MKKRFFKILFSILLVISMLPTPVFSAQVLTAGVCGDNAIWSFDPETFVLTISGSGDIEFSWLDVDGFELSIREVVIENGITNINPAAFNNCDSLTEVSIPDSVVSIGANAFSDCDNLKSVIFGNNSQLLRIDGGAFQVCTSLTDFTIPDSVKIIEDGAFSGCTNLIQVENNVSYVDKWVVEFESSTAVTSVTLRDGTVGIGALAFYYCKFIKEVNLPDSVASICRASFAYSGINKINIPETVTNIDKNAFLNCPLSTFIYCGTEEQWEAIEKGDNWNEGFGEEFQFHNYVNGMCTECDIECAHKTAVDNICADCGMKVSTVMLGDVNEDGTVTNADVLVIFRYIYNANVYPLDVAIGDVNRDGVVTNADVLVIYRYIYNPELYPIA